MTFRVVSNGGASCCEWIAADGIIAISTPLVFKEFLKGLGPVGPTLQESITFNSPGGDFFAALALGREIRRSTQMWTAVGRTVINPDIAEGEPRSYQTAPGVCLSSCVLAFMGGKTRDYDPSNGTKDQILAFQNYAIDQPASVLGQSSAGAMADAGLPTPGLLRLAVEGYAFEMGIGRDVVGLMETAGQAGGVHVVTKDEANYLALNTPSVARTKWNLSVVRGGLALYGSGDDRWTHYDVGLQCRPGQNGALEYTVAVPVDTQNQNGSQLIATYRQGITGVEVSDLETSTTTRSEISAVGIAGSRLFVTTWFDGVTLDMVRRGEGKVQFDTPHSLANRLPTISLTAPQTVSAIDTLLKNCPAP
jgi:hypothetical protein